MKQDRAHVLLSHMIEAARLATEYVAGMSKEAFLADRRTQQAVVYNIAVLGEAAASLARDASGVLDRYPDVPWPKMRGMRNRLMHGYFEVDLNLVWNTVGSDLPPLLDRLSAIRAEMAGAGGRK